MEAPILHQWQGQHFWLSAERCMYWEEEQTLIAADLHLGKSGHFRKNGIAIPQEVLKQDLQRFFSAIQFFKPRQCLVVGDLFHSEANKELEWFARWRMNIPNTAFVLVKGNHDILPQEWYVQNQIKVVNELTLLGIHFKHDPPKKGEIAPDFPIICGHLHPGILLSTGARQQKRLPCFYFEQNTCILPAFGLFTGLFTLKPKKQDEVFAIVGQSVIKIK